MHRYSGIFTYLTDNSGRIHQQVNVVLQVSFFPGHFEVFVEDEGAHSVHNLRNRRFNYQARDSPQDLLARAKWRSEWFDRFEGPAYLAYPRVTGVPREIRFTLICSWDPAFAVLEFRLGDTFYQFSCRPPRGVNSWARLRFPMPTHFNDSQTDQRSDGEENEPARGSNDPPEDAPPFATSSSPFGGSDRIIVQSGPSLNKCIYSDSFLTW